jgi:hypothetical protein
LAKRCEKLKRFIPQAIDIIHCCVRRSAAHTVGNSISNHAEKRDRAGERACPKPRRSARYTPADRNSAARPMAGISTIANADYEHRISPDRYSAGTTQKACQINEPRPTAMIAMVYAPMRRVGIVSLTDRLAELKDMHR